MLLLDVSGGPNAPDFSIFPILGGPLNLFVVGTLIRVFLYLIVLVFERDAGLPKHLLGLGSGMIPAFADDANNAAIDDEHGADTARSHAAVEGGSVDGNAELRSLADGILFGMHGPDAMVGYAAVLMDHLLHVVADIVAVLEARRRADVSCDE